MLAQGKLKNKTSELQRALNGLIGEHQRMILTSQLKHIDFLEKQIELVTQEIEKRLEDDMELIELLDTIPGIGKIAAEHIIAEIGTDMSRFPIADHLASWAGICPGNNESAGKKGDKTSKGNKYLRITLVETARAASRTKHSYFHSQYSKIAARRGHNRACVAVAHSLLIVIYHMLCTKSPYIELGEDYFDRINKKAKV